MSSSPRRQAALGLFVTGAFGIFAAGLFALGDLADLVESKTTVTTTFASVEGLGKGDAVWFSGVPVGTVKRVELSDAGVLVTLGVEADAAALIPHDAVASIGSDGLIGNSLVVLDGGGQNLGLVEDTHLASKQTTGMQQLMTGLQQTNDNLLAITESVMRVTNDIDEGRGNIGRLLSDEQIADDLMVTARALRTTAGEAEQVTGRLASITRAMDQEGSMVHELAHDDQTWSNVQDAVANLELASEDARNMVGDLDTALDDPASPLGVLLKDPEAGRDVEDTLDNLAGSTEKLEENLEALQHNFFLRGYFKKKERQERKAREQAQKTAAVEPPDRPVPFHSTPEVSR